MRRLTTEGLFVRSGEGRDAVFRATHRLTLELIREGKLDGLRIDHPDGLYDPAQYFAKLQKEAGRSAPDARLTETLSAAPAPG